MIVQQLRTAFFTAFPSTSSQPEFNIIDASGNAIPEYVYATCYAVFANLFQVTRDYSWYD